MATLVARWYARQLPLFAHGTLLDLGCGKVPFRELYAPHVEEILCTDWLNSLHGNDFLDFASDLNIGLPLRDSSIDTAIVSDVLEHVYRPQMVLNELHRILRPGGVVLMNVPFLYVVHEAPFDFYRYTQFAVARMAEEAGLAVERIDPLGSKALAFADITGKILQGATALGGLLAVGLQRTTLALSNHLPRSAKFPLEVAAVLRKAPSGSAAIG